MMLKLSPDEDDKELRVGIEDDHELSDDETPQMNLPGPKPLH